jgi:hypothetical protein
MAAFKSFLRTQFRSLREQVNGKPATPARRRSA